MRLVVTRAARTMSAWDTSPGTTPSTRAGAAGDELAEGGFGQPQEGAHDAQNRPRVIAAFAIVLAGSPATAQSRKVLGWLTVDGGVGLAVFDHLFEAPLVVSSTGAGGWAGGASRPRGRCGSAGGRRWRRRPSGRSSARTSSPASRLARCRGQRSSPQALILQVMRERRRGRSSAGALTEPGVRPGGRPHARRASPAPRAVVSFVSSPPRRASCRAGPGSPSARLTGRNGGC